MRRLPWKICLAFGLGAGSALAQEPAPPASASPDDAASVTRDRSEIEDDDAAQHRSGLSFGLAGGLTLGNVHGYPNDLTKIDEPEFEVNTGLGVNTGGVLWVGGALADWLNVGIGMLGGGTNGNGLVSSGFAVQIRIEAFPLYYRGGLWRDAGVLFTAGTGGYTVERGSEMVAEGAGTSVVGAGVFMEPWRFWRFATGPQIEYAHHFSRSLSAHALVIGWRTAFYAGP